MRRRECGLCCSDPCLHGKVKYRCSKCKAHPFAKKARGLQPKGFLWLEGLGYVSNPATMALGSRGEILPVEEPPDPPPKTAQTLPPALSLAGVVACESVVLPPVVSLAARPGGKLPSRSADRVGLPCRCFNPFEDAAPRGTFDEVARQIVRCVNGLLCLPADDAAQNVLLFDYNDLKGFKSLDVDEKMSEKGACGFIIHTPRDVLIAGLNPQLARRSLMKVAEERGAMSVVTEAAEMVPLVQHAAERHAGDFSIHDDYTTRFGYSTGQVNALPTNPSAEFLSRAIMRGGPCSLHFLNRGEGDSLGASRAMLRQELVEGAKDSEYYREEWLPKGRPRVTANFRTACKWVRAPFTVTDALPLASDAGAVRLATWETTLRGVEEHLMLSIFGSLPNVTWARILAKVFERAETIMGEFDSSNYRQWAAASWRHAHGVGPGKLGCPWKDGASRLIPKGACGIKPSKNRHDDDNGVISLSCWTSLTEADAPIDLVFAIHRCEVILRASALRWVLFMGYVPHETRPANPSQPVSTPRLHHSSFVKPEAEHLAAQILSFLPCKRGGGDWTMDAVHRLRAEAFAEDSMRAVLKSGAEEALCRIQSQADL